MPWQIRPDSGPSPAPWDGRDATGWVWRIYGDGDTSRAVLVEVSGTAMAIADEYLPDETRRARASSGRSEVEKVLDLEDPPTRLSLGTTGYLSDSPTASLQPDFLIRDRDGHFVAAVEVKNPDVLTLPAAAVVRDRLVPPGTASDLHYVLVVSQNRAYLYDVTAQTYDPVAEIPMFSVVERYFPPAIEEQRFRGRELQVLVLQWLRDLAAGSNPPDAEAERLLADHGFLDAVRGGQVETEPS